MIKRKKILIITVASNKYGYGHLNRSLNLKSYLNKKFIIKIINFTNEQPKKFFTFSFMKVNKILNKSLFLKYDKIILDISNNKIFKEKKFIKTLSFLTIEFKKKIILIDSIGREMLNNYKKIHFSTLICPYFFSNQLKFKKRKKVKYLIGEKFIILPSSYENVKIKNLNKKIENLMISCGGSDQSHNSLKILEFLEKLNIRLRINIVVGPFFSKELKLKIDNFKQISYNKIKIYNNQKNLKKVISNSQICIISSGLTKYETASTGLPSIVFCENKKQQILNKSYEKRNISLNIGMINNLNKYKAKIIKLMNSSQKLKDFNIKSKKTINFKGPQRIIKIIGKN
jgi:UDP-2,4-diacetamido-2,4,6-trideoxy-beta-L-altropyranose hydrolase